jgi:hypothetical protein
VSVLLPYVKVVRSSRSSCALHGMIPKFRIAKHLIELEGLDLSDTRDSRPRVKWFANVYDVVRNFFSTLRWLGSRHPHQSTSTPNVMTKVLPCCTNLPTLCVRDDYYLDPYSYIGDFHIYVCNYIEPLA